MEEGHKVLVFSQFVTMLDLIARDGAGSASGRTSISPASTENRGELVKDFQSAEGAPSS